MERRGEDVENGMVVGQERYDRQMQADMPHHTCRGCGRDCYAQDQVGDLCETCRMYTPTERLTLHFEIPAEPNWQCNHAGECGCDACRESGTPVELWKGMTVFRLDGKEIYCDCLQEYLRARQKTIGEG